MSATNNTSLDILLGIPIFLHRYITGIVYIVGNLGNLLNLLIFCKKSWRKNVCVFYFLICIPCNTIFINCTLLGSIFNYGFRFYVHYSNPILCKLYFYLSFLSSTYYPTILIFASFDRLLLSSQNVNTRLYSSKRLAYLFVSANFLLWSIFYFHILIKVNVQQITITQSMCTYEFSVFYLNFIKYSTLILNVLIALLLIILSILALKNVRRIRANPSSQRQQVRTMHKKDFQLLRCLYIHNIVYIISNMTLIAGLYFTITLNNQRSTLTEQVWSTFLSQFGAFLNYIPSCSHFFVFIYLSKAFRLELKRMVCKITGRNLVIAREEANPIHESNRENIELNKVAVSAIVLSH